MTHKTRKRAPQVVIDRDELAALRRDAEIGRAMKRLLGGALWSAVVHASKAREAKAAEVAKAAGDDVPPLERDCAHARIRCPGCDERDFCVHLWTKCRCAVDGRRVTRWE